MLKTRIVKRTLVIVLIMILIISSLSMVIPGWFSYAKNEKRQTVQTKQGVENYNPQKNWDLQISGVNGYNLLNQGIEYITKINTFSIGPRYFQALDPSTGIYCIQYGIDFEAGTYYPYASGNLSNTTAYIVAKANPMDYEYYDGIFRTDIRQNVVWEEMSGGSHKSDYIGMANDIKVLTEEANLAQNIDNDSIKIGNPSDSDGFLAADEEGKYGPFKVEYPEVAGNTVKVEFNGEEIVPTPKSGEEFYIEDGIKFGEENVIKVTYTATKYEGNLIAYKHAEEGLLNENGEKIEHQDIAEIITKPREEEYTNEIKFKPLTLDLSGKVWLDGQTGIKPIISPDGQYNNGETTIEGIRVILKRKSDGAQVAEAITNKDGSYIFENIPASKVASDKYTYYIEFEYDGINYRTTTSNVGKDEGIDSDVEEIGRKDFNNRFQTIEKYTDIGINGKSKNLEYTYNSNSAKLITMDKNGVKDEFKMIAITTDYYTKTTENIDMGLVKKELDLAIATDLYSAVVSINGKSITYNYDEITIDGDNIVIGNNDKPTYNLHLYNSDYNYRINDYKLDAAQKDYLNISSITGGKEGLLSTRQKDGDLQVELTYQILLNNQSATEATINQIAYYYDTRLILPGATPELVTMDDGQTYNKVTLDVNAKFTDVDNQYIVTIPFYVAKNDLGYIELGKMKNWAEITSYSTTEGCIDIDSAPDNILEHKTEDDTDDARGVDIQVNNSTPRIISGYVFEDKYTIEPGKYGIGDGVYNNDDEKINDVIVQLIEIKNVEIEDASTGTKAIYKLEYIWQETVSGSSTVRVVTIDGRNIAEYNNGVTNPGEYKFVDFIPGNYIVRFIYGDGTYYDKDINGNDTSDGIKKNIQKYNGQDYKSTRDIGYNSSSYDIALSKYESAYGIESSKDCSMARDNEARRLEEMAYAVSVGDAEVLKIDNKDELTGTWMCAETSKIEIPVENKKDTTGKEQIIEKIVNFGLTKRPQMELLLEKHVTSVKIGTDIGASADINNYSTEGKVNLKDIKGTVTADECSDKEKNKRGLWLIQTQIEDLQGKEISITYDYIIKNTGSLDYIGKNLQEKLKTFTYDKIAEDVKAKMSQADVEAAIGLNLGKAYYTGVPENEDKVRVSVKVEDYISTTNNFNMIGGNFQEIEENPIKEKDIISSEGNSAKENVKVITTKDQIDLSSEDSVTYSLELVNRDIDTTSSKKTYRCISYAAQLVPGESTGMITTDTGTLIKGVTLGNLDYVQSYAPTLIKPLKDIVPEADESIAETVEITVDTGGDKQTPMLLMFTIAGALTIVAIGIVLIKKFVIK